MNEVRSNESDNKANLHKIHEQDELLQQHQY
jgi:hypothetical protein